MGDITNVLFTGEINLDGVKIQAGMTTQVRWDLGIGSMNIDGNGKIVMVDHYWPLPEDLRAAFNEEMLGYTGVLDANIGQLIFHQGQLTFLDLTVADDAVRAVLSATIAGRPKWKDWSGHPMPASIDEDDWLALKASLEQSRKDLVAADSPYEDFVTASYVNRSRELIDPYHGR